ncbi:MAG TPA: hypothetical protein VLI06_07060 [Solimonas sp.]|nr:hypothetical protein [Solimonas sp.]
MAFRKTLLALATLLSFTAAADPRPLPGSDLMAPGSNTVGTPDYGKDVKVGSTTAAASPDRNGDGFLEPSELEPGSQLSKRFATRDANRDGKLSRQEYYFQ